MHAPVIALKDVYCSPSTVIVPVSLIDLGIIPLSSASSMAFCSAIVNCCPLNVSMAFSDKASWSGWSRLTSIFTSIACFNFSPLVYACNISSNFHAIQPLRAWHQRTIRAMGKRHKVTRAVGKKFFSLNFLKPAPKITAIFAHSPQHASLLKISLTKVIRTV